MWIEDAGAVGSDTRVESESRVDTRVETGTAPAAKRLFATDNGMILGRYKDTDAAIKALQHYRNFVSGGKTWNEEAWRAIGEADGFTPSTSAPENYEGLGELFTKHGLNGDATDAIDLIGEKMKAHNLSQDQVMGVMGDVLELWSYLEEANGRGGTPTDYSPSDLTEGLRGHWGDETDTRILANQEFVANTPYLAEALEQPLGQSLFGLLIVDSIRGLMQDAQPLVQTGAPMGGGQIDSLISQIEQIRTSDAFNNRSHPKYQETGQKFLKLNEALANAKANKLNADFKALKF